MSQQEPPESFVVGLDRAAVLRRRERIARDSRWTAVLLLVVGAVGIGLGIVALVAFRESAVWPFAALLVLSALPVLIGGLLTLRLDRDRRRWYAANELTPAAIRMSPRGLELAFDGAAYPVLLPWPTVRGFEQVKLFGQYVLEVRLRPKVAATTAGVRGLDQPAVRSVVRPNGLVRQAGFYPVNALTESVPVIDQALRHYSGGRTTVLR